MAARTRKTELSDAWRDKIRVTMLLLALEKHALGQQKMGATQIRAAEILLRKVVPDLSSMAYTGEITHRYVARVPEVSPSVDAWEREHVPPPSVQ